MVLIYLLLASNLWLFLHSFKQVQKEIHDAGFYIDADLTDRKIDKKVQFRFMFQVLFFGWLVIPKIDLSDELMMIVVCL